MTTLNKTDLDQLIAKAQAAPRKRAHHNLHTSLDAAVQRLAIAMEPETYVRPHRHPQTWELYLPLTGEFKVIIFDENATVLNCFKLGGADGLRAFELPQNTWHSVSSLVSGSIIFEVKEGPYIQPTDADVASWSPPENHTLAADFQQFLLSAQPGQRYQNFTPY
jgi:cupin fold WbuC family metalloprotein